MNLVYLWLEYLKDGAFSGAATFDNTLGVTGLITATAGLTAATNQHVTVSGTGRFKHGDLVRQVQASAGQALPATGGWDYSQSIAGQASMWATPNAANDDLVFPIPVEVGERIKSVAARVQDTVTGTSTISLYLHKSDGTADFTSGSAQVGSTATSAGDGTRQTLTVGSLTETVATNVYYSAVVRANGTNWATHRVVGLEVTYDRP